MSFRAIITFLERQWAAHTCSRTNSKFLSVHPHAILLREEYGVKPQIFTYGFHGQISARNLHGHGESSCLESRNIFPQQTVYTLSARRETIQLPNHSLDRTIHIY